MLRKNADSQTSKGFGDKYLGNIYVKIRKETEKRKCGHESPHFLSTNFDGTPGMIRTCDPLIRSQVLYPAELRVHKGEQIDYKSIGEVSSLLGEMLIWRNSPGGCAR